MTVTPCRTRSCAIDELPPLDVTANSDSVPAIERQTSSGQALEATQPDAAELAALTEPAPTKKRKSRARLWTSLATMAALALVVYTLRDKLPSAHSVSIALTSAQPRWVLVAAVLEALSLGMFARQQRSLLAAMSVRMSMPRAIAVTYARSAISISMPAGSAVSAAFAYQQFRRSGANRDNAAAVMVLSGIVSFTGLAMLYVLGVAGVVVVSPEQAWHAHSELIITVAAITVTTLATWFIVKRLPARAPSATRGDIVGASDLSRVRRWSATAVAVIRNNVSTWRSVRPRHWAASVTYAVLNWLFDLLCLAAAAAAFGLHVGMLTLAGIYLGVQLVRQVPITPGGIGLIETGLLAGFAALGAPAATAAAVVLTYRILSCWLLIPIGGFAWLGLRAATPAQAEIAPPVHAELATANAD